jgi:four helix bundle protein
MGKARKTRAPRASRLREVPPEYGRALQVGRRFDLEERTFRFAQAVRQLFRRLPRTIANEEDMRQLARASASVGANYIEANEALGARDLRLHIKISRKESKESRFFLRLLDAGEDPVVSSERDVLVKESTELMNIFGAIFRKLEASAPGRERTGAA